MSGHDTTEHEGGEMTDSSPGPSLRGRPALGDEPITEDEMRERLAAEREAREDAADQALRDDGWDW